MTNTVITRIYLVYLIRPNYFLSPSYYGRMQERHIFNKSSVFDSEFGNDGVSQGSQACVSAWQ